jgi:hypothetical protein
MMGHDTRSTDEGHSVARIDYRTVAEAGPAVMERLARARLRDHLHDELRAALADLLANPDSVRALQRARELVDSTEGGAPWCPRCGLVNPDGGCDRSPTGIARGCL